MSTSNPFKNFDYEKQDYKVKPKSNKKYDKSFYLYNIFLFIMMLSPVTAVGIFNWLIDPHDVFNTPNYLGVNHIKPDKDDNDRLFKAIDITRIKPKTIIVGSSRTKQGINPEHPVFDQSLGVYNLAINGPNFYEVKRYVEHAIYNQPSLEQIVLGIDFFMFNNHLKNQPTFSESRLEKTHLTLDDGVKVLFSFDSLNNSKNTIEASSKTQITQESYGNNGFMPNRNANKAENIWRFNQSIKLYFTLHSDYEFSEQYWSDFAKLVQLCREKDIQLKVFISPSHATQWESIYITNRWQVFEDWKRKIVQLTPVWDFSGYNSVTTEKIKNNMNNYVDSSHYTPEIGDLIINRLFNYQTNQVPDDFGVLLTPKNIEYNLDRITQERQKWLNSHSEEVDLVKKLFTNTQNVKKIN